MNTWNTSISYAGLLLAAIAVLLALDARSAAEPSRIAAAPALSIDGLRREVRALREETSRLRGDVSSLPEPPAATAAASTGNPDPSPGAAGERPASRTSELLALGRRILSNEVTPDETARFYELARAPGLIDNLLADLEGEVAESPSSVEPRLRLADAYVIKLLTLPAGPEMAVWSGKAEAEWREVLEREPDHWKARFSLAVSLSYHPDVVGSAPEAIAHLERLVRQQEALTPEPRQADTYRLLAILHRRRGDREKAELALRWGRERHPDDPKIEKALEEYER